MRDTLRAAWVWIALSVWGSACAAGIWGLWTYSNTPNQDGGPSLRWHIPDALLAGDGRPTLIVFAHPRCPCTRATMSELERLQRDAAGLFATRVVFYEPQEADASWRRTDLWSRAERLPDAEAIADPGGAMGAEAGARASGTVVLIDAGGALQFWGGMTAARGHEGESVGSIALRSLLHGREPRHRRTPVFGCDLQSPGCATTGCEEGKACHAPTP